MKDSNLLGYRPVTNRGNDPSVDYLTRLRETPADCRWADRQADRIRVG